MSEMSKKRNTRKTVVGVVKSDSMNKTIVVESERLEKHPRFGKYVKRYSRYKAHDEKNECRVGDTVELRALRQVYGQRGPQVGLSSIKSNLGHLLAAAGLAGLVKGVLSLKHQIMAPIAGFDEPNPRLGVVAGVIAFLVSGPRIFRWRRARRARRFWIG